MAHSSDYKHLYIDSPATGLSIDEIKKCLGANTRSLGNLCKDVDKDGNAANLIRKWQKIKPVRSSRLDSIDQAETLVTMKEANYGFGGLDMFSNVDTTTIFNTAIANACDWPYLKPRGKGNGTNGNDEWYRKTDFNGYRHDASTPPISLDAGVIEAADDNPKRVYVSFQVNTAAHLSLLDFSFADLSRWDSINDYNFKYAVMIRKSGSTGAPTIYYGINVFKYENSLLSYNHGGYGEGLGPNEIIYFPAPSDATPAAPYQIVPCIIRHNATTDGACIYLPGEIFFYNGGSSARVRADQFQITACRKTHEPTAAEAASGTGYFDVEFDISFRALNAQRQVEFGETTYYFRFYARLQSAGGAWGDYVLGTGSINVPAAYYQQTYTGTLTFKRAYDTALYMAAQTQAGSVHVEFSDSDKNPVFSPALGQYYPIATFV